MLVSITFVQLIVAALVLITVAAGSWLVLRTRRHRADPIVDAKFKELQQGWYQLSLSIANPSQHALGAVSLRRVRPRSARLMLPISLVNTKEGNFQVWSDPSTDTSTASIPLSFVIEPSELRLDANAPHTETQTSVWLFLPRTPPSHVTLELTLRDVRGKLRRHRFVATREA